MKRSRPPVLFFMRSVEVRELTATPKTGGDMMRRGAVDNVPEGSEDARV